MAGDYLASENIRTLDQAMEVVRALDDERYRYRCPEAHDGAPGDQFRHIFEYYVLLMKGWPARCIDYDRCVRDKRFEADRGYALDQLHAMTGALKTLGIRDGKAPLRVKMDHGSGRGAEWTCSTLARELNLLAHHDRHHFSLIAFMLRQIGWHSPPAFGTLPISASART